MSAQGAAINALRTAERKAKEEKSKAVEVIGKLLFDMCEHHADELRDRHGKDEKERGIGKHCSYCRDMEEAAAVLIELTGLDEFTYPDNWPLGVWLGKLRRV